MLSLFALSPSLNVPMRAPAPAMMATVASLEVKAGCYEYRSLAQDVQTTKIPTVPYGVGKSMESQNCYGRSQALGLSLGLSHQVEGEKAPAGASAGSVSSFEKGIVYTTALGGAASTETLSKGWAQMQC